jgi:DNA-binding CsgD family transcriptional regulator
MDTLTKFIIDTAPTGVIVFSQKMEIVFCNKKAIQFLNRHKPPDELTTLSKRMFDANATDRFHELFPGEVYLYKNLEGSSSNWIFRFLLYNGSAPFIVIFVIEETVSNKLNINTIRQRYKLTRRETDVLRRVLDGLTNLDIAEDLDIAEQTVKDYLTNVYTKTGAGNRFSLMHSLLNQFSH